MCYWEVCNPRMCTWCFCHEYAFVRSCVTRYKGQWEITLCQGCPVVGISSVHCCCVDMCVH